MKRTAPLFALCAVVLAGCNADTPMQADHGMHANDLSLSSLSSSTNAQALADLKQLTAPLHDVDAAVAAHYGLLTAVPATAADGCISSATQGGMGYHYTRGDNLADDLVSLLDPEFLVYAPKNGPRQDGEARTRLAALEYFLPFSAKWPAKSDPTFKAEPTLHDFPTMQGLPDVKFVQTTRFGGWMLHIWLWEDNKAGMFENWNTGVPLCEGSSF
jgi:hypothetical protein